MYVSNILKFGQMDHPKRKVKRGKIGEGRETTPNYGVLGEVTYRGPTTHNGTLACNRNKGDPASIGNPKPSRGTLPSNNFTK